MSARKGILSGGNWIELRPIDTMTIEQAKASG